MKSPHIPAVALDHVGIAARNGALPLATMLGGKTDRAPRDAQRSDGRTVRPRGGARARVAADRCCTRVELPRQAGPRPSPPRARGRCLACGVALTAGGDRNAVRRRDRALVRRASVVVRPSLVHRWRADRARAGHAMISCDSVVRGGRVVLPEARAPFTADVAIKDGLVLGLLAPGADVEADNIWDVKRSPRVSRRHRPARARQLALPRQSHPRQLRAGHPRGGGRWDDDDHRLRHRGARITACRTARPASAGRGPGRDRLLVPRSGQRRDPRGARRACRGGGRGCDVIQAVHDLPAPRARRQRRDAVGRGQARGRAGRGGGGARRGRRSG